MRVGHHLLVAAGVASIVYMVVATGVDALLTPIRALSWRIVVLMVVPAVVVELLHTVAWRLVFVDARFPLRRLFSARLAGEALNLGAASVGGEPVKAYLLRPWVPLAESAATLVVDKTAITVGQILFLAIGLVVAVSSFDLPADFRWGMTILLGVQMAVVTAFVLVQCVGLGGRTLRLLRRLGVTAGAARATGVLQFDRALTASYRDRWGRALGCTLVHLVGWLVGGLEVYLVLWWLDVGTSLSAALAIDAVGIGIKFIGFAIPGTLGVFEGGYMLAFSVFGFGGGLGLSFTLVRRLRMIAWGAVGLILMAPLRTAKAPSGA